MDKIALISSPISEAWPMWLMFGLLLCVTMAEVLQPETLRLAFRTTFTKLDRTYGDRASDLISSVLLNVFRVGSLAMALYVFTWHREPFSILTFGGIVLLILGIVSVKVLCSFLVAYTYEMRGAAATYLPQYGNLWTMLCVLLYPLTLLYINIPESVVLRWFPLIIIGLFVVMILFKLLQYFYAGFRSLIYLLVYWVTLELLPLGAGYVVVSQMT